MALNKGKAFEAKFKEDILKIPESSLDRLYDTTNGFKAISQICDFIFYKLPNIFYIELKTHKGNTFPLENLTQYNKLVKKVGIPGVRTGAIIWFQDHDRVIYVPIDTVTKLKLDGKKSVNIRKIEAEGYRIINIPSIKKRVFLDSDYSVLLNLNDGD